VRCAVRLPSEVSFFEEPQIVRWDYDNKLWKTDGFVDKLYNEGQLSGVADQATVGVLGLYPIQMILKCSSCLTGRLKMRE